MDNDRNDVTPRSPVMTDEESTAGILAALRGEADPRLAPMLLIEFERQFAEDRDLVLAVSRKLIELGAGEGLLAGFVAAAMAVGRLGFGIELFQAATGADKTQSEARH